MAEEGAKMAGPIRMVAIERMVENMRYKAQIIARSNKFDSAISESGVIGFAAGLFVALVLIVVPAIFV
jgi:tetrahydromethanopterin S-methyltransferase subunit F